jgi:hypothetical protein
MAELKTVGVKDLKDNLSAYLREVRRGTRILVTDRSRIVAELHEPGVTYAADPSVDAVLAEWTRAGIVTLPTRPPSSLPATGIALPDGTASSLLDQERAEGKG